MSSSSVLEPYLKGNQSNVTNYDWYMLEHGYQYLSQGYMHKIFVKDKKIYKIVKPEFFSTYNTYDHFAKEMYNHNYLERRGFPAVRVNHIYNIGEIVPDFYVLEENYIEGSVYTQSTIPQEFVYKIINLLIAISDIEIDHFGLNQDKVQFTCWREHINYLLDCAKEIAEKYQVYSDFELLRRYFTEEYEYKLAPKFLIFDPNEENFIFDDEQKILAIIDVDHATGGDPLWQMGCIYYHRPHYKEIIFSFLNNEEKETVIQYALLHGLNDIAFRMSSNSADTSGLKNFAHFTLHLSKE